MRRNCTDYDGMGNQGRFPMVKESANVDNKMSRTFVIVIACALISLLMLTSCEKELLTDEKDKDNTNTNQVTTQESQEQGESQYRYYNC